MRYKGLKVEKRRLFFCRGMVEGKKIIVDKNLKKSELKKTLEHEFLHLKFQENHKFLDFLLFKLDKLFLFSFFLTSNLIFLFPFILKELVELWIFYKTNDLKYGFLRILRDFLIVFLCLKLFKIIWRLV